MPLYLFLTLPLLLPLILCPASGFISPLAPSSNDCIDVACPEADVGRIGLLKKQDLLDVHNKSLDNCRDCVECTHSGYSVCVQPRHFDDQRRQLVTEQGACECAHSGPAILDHAARNSTSLGHVQQQQSVQCRLVPAAVRGKPVEEPELEFGEGIFRICYSSALRKLPTPKAFNENATSSAEATDRPVLVTVDQFWLSNYWQALRPRHLRLFYVFPISKREHCAAQVLVPSAQDMMWIIAGKTKEQVTNSGMTWLCKASLSIVMNGLEQHEEEHHQQHAEHASAEDGGDGTDAEDVEYYDDADPEMPPEVQFDRDVFVGADKVRFYYELKVHRENQLKPSPGRPRFESRQTTIKSDSLDFDLHPEIYGTGMDRSRSSTSPIDRVNIEQHGKKASEGEGPREPIVRPSHGRTGKAGGKSAERPRTTQTTELMAKTNPSTSASSSSSHGPRPIQSRPAADSIHFVEPSTSVPAPSKPQFERDEDDDDEEEYAEDEGSSTASNAKSSSPNLQIAGRPDPSEEDWILLRNVLLISLLLLTIFVLIAFCYKRGMCCFPSRSSRTSGNGGAGQQRNGKTRVQNGKEYMPASK